ncbi:histidine phosphatase family protein [Thermodesulfobacteriota bacterium]
MANEKTFYLIRHAQSHPTSKCHYSEWPLSLIGSEQAEELSGLLEPLGIQKIFSSPFSRCLETVEPFSRKSGVQLFVEDDLRERLVVKSLAEGFDEIWRKSWEDFNFALPGCENSTDAQMRFVTAVRRILGESSEKTIGISTHGNVIGLFLSHIDCSFGRKEADKLMNPDVIRITVQNGLYTWDREFNLPGIDDIRTDHSETPMDI